MTDTATEFGTFDSDGNYIPRQIIDADLGGVDIEEAYTSTMVLVEDGQLVEGTVVRVDQDEVLLDIGYKSEGSIPANEFDDISEVKVGDGFEDGVAFGPLINDAAIAKVQEHIADATSKGAEVILGGGESVQGPGHFLPPTIVTGATRDMAVSTEETFGPMAPLFRFSDVDDVIDMANDTIFGLASYFYAKDLSRVYKVAEALEYGIVGVNTGIISTEVAPFGGVKQSGLGREGSHHGIDDFLEMKYVCMSV